MRFKLTLKVNKNKYGDLLPINYQYEASAVIYKILSLADKEYARWLHDNGFEFDNGKKFKLFTFSRIMIPEYQILKAQNRIKILSENVEWQISFLPEKSTQHFIEGLFLNQIFEIGDKKSVVQFVISCVEAMPEPEYSENMEFKTMSPLCIKFKLENGKTNYLSPTDVRGSYIIYNGLLDRYRSFYRKELPCKVSDCRFEVIGTPKSVLITIKACTPYETKVRGYMCCFKVKAPVELMKLIYSSGAGSQCSQGFGCVEVIKNN